MKLRMLKAELWILGPKNLFCRFTWDETVGCTFCGWWMERLVRSRGLFFWSQPDLGLDADLTMYKHQNLRGKSHALSEPQFPNQSNGNKMVASNED